MPREIPYQYPRTVYDAHVRDYDRHTFDPEWAKAANEKYESDRRQYRIDNPAVTREELARLESEMTSKQAKD